MTERRRTRRVLRSDLVPVAAVLSILIGILIASPFLLDALWGNVPIVFYGRIIDDGGRGVAGVTVTMHVLAERRLQIPALFNATQTGWVVSATTDANGMFTIRGGRGTELQMLTVRKQGYSDASPVGQNGVFDYSARLGTGNVYRPDPANPAIFRLYK